MESRRLWDIFCKVIDNFGDIGVCWRLTADLASRGHRVRLWVDDASALAWLAPGALEGRRPGIQVMGWAQAQDADILADLPAADVWIEGFGCEIPPEFVAHRFRSSTSVNSGLKAAPVWLDLEYLSAEPFVERSHGLPSPVMHGPAGGHTKFFFYPGFTNHTGGLLRECNLTARQANFDRQAWLQLHDIPWKGERLVSLFCYEPAALHDLLSLLQQEQTATRLLVTHGRAATAVRRLIDFSGHDTENPVAGTWQLLTFSFLPLLAQTDYDHLLWSCDLNFVRGEDSLVRAIWAGKPFVWQIYPQRDDAHHAKLETLLDAVAAPDSWRDFHLAWNSIGNRRLNFPDLPVWRAAVQMATRQLLLQTDLTERLLAFVEAARQAHQNEAEKR